MLTGQLAAIGDYHDGSGLGGLWDSILGGYRTDPGRRHRDQVAFGARRSVVWCGQRVKVEPVPVGAVSGKRLWADVSGAQLLSIAKEEVPMSEQTETVVLPEPHERSGCSSPCAVDARCATRFRYIAV